jgi:hypothetical protein
LWHRSNTSRLMDMQSFAETVQSFAVVEKDSGNRASKIE